MAEHAIWRKFTNFIGLTTAEEEDDIIEAGIQEPAGAEYMDRTMPSGFAPRSARGGKIVPMPYANQGDNPRHQTIIYAIQSLEDVSRVIDDLVNGHSVILNLEQLDEKAAQRTIDQLSGAAYAVKTVLRRTAANSYLIAPVSVQVEEVKPTQRRAAR